MMASSRGLLASLTPQSVTIRLDRSLLRLYVLMHVAGLAADVRFVHLNLARQLSYGPLLHGEPYAVHQEPSRFLGEGKEMGRDGRACAYLDLSRDTSKPESQVHRDPMVKELVEELRDRVAFLERSPEQRSVEAERYQQMVVGLTQTNNRLSATLEIRISRLPGTSKGQIPRASLDAYSLYCTPRPLLPDFDSGHVVEVREALKRPQAPARRSARRLTLTSTSTHPSNGEAGSMLPKVSSLPSPLSP
jgi:hypothetical protein